MSGHVGFVPESDWLDDAALPPLSQSAKESTKEGFCHREIIYGARSPVIA
jgi:hypothetical protein